VLAVSAALLGCGPEGTGALALSWRFADGRGCLDAGAGAMLLNVDGSDLGRRRCDDALAPITITLDPVDRGGRLTLVANTLQGNEGYRGEVVLDALLSPTTVVLFATGTR